jgi:hypothetical protein
MFRIGRTLKVALRAHHVQLKKGSRSFDFVQQPGVLFRCSVLFFSSFFFHFFFFFFSFFSSFLTLFSCSILADISDGLIHPKLGDFFESPNGMSVRPRGPNMWEILDKFRGPCNVWIIPQGTPLPKELVLIHEHNDHFSVQTAGTIPFPS